MSLTRIEALRVGHATDRAGATGCTVILARDGVVAGCDIGGAATGTRELDACRPGHLVGAIHGLLLTGGSAFGLDAAGGVMRFLEARGAGFDTGVARVPIVPAAVLYDLAVGRPGARPGPAMGLRACRAASSRPVVSGCVGAGTGATVGKLFGVRHATKSGVGSAAARLPARAGGATVAVLAAVNAFGDVRDPDSGAIVAGARDPEAPRGATRFAGTAALMARGVARRGFAAPNTTLVVVATDARLDRVEACRVSSMCQDGLASAVSPAHTRYDGDLVFTLSAGRRRADPDVLAACACRAVADAVLDAVRSAATLGGVPALRDLRLAPQEEK